jgi:uroporphyrinogen-III synthase
MFVIHDAPDPAPVEAWIRRCIDTPCDDVVLTTGEGLRRLVAAARRVGLDAGLVEALGAARCFARGPKPGRALREIGLAPYATTQTPTSEGIAAMLAGENLKGHRVGLQLYPDKDHGALVAAIAAGGAAVDPVLPYVYDPQAADDNIVRAIDEMVAGRVDAIALTSSGQSRRLFDAARANGCEDRLRQGLARTRIAAVGPVVIEELAGHGLTADIVPVGEAFFMKPLISAMAQALRPDAPGAQRATR